MRLSSRGLFLAWLIPIFDPLLALALIAQRGGCGRDRTDPGPSFFLRINQDRCRSSARPDAVHSSTFMSRVIPTDFASEPLDAG